MKCERDVKAKIKKILDKNGWFWFSPPASAYGRSGISDIIAFKGGVLIVIEAKFGTNKPTAMQVGFLNSVRAESGYGLLVSDRNIEFLDQFLESFAVATEAASRGEMPPQEHGSRMVNALYMLTRY